MPLEIPLVWTDTHRRHHPTTGVWLGLPIPVDELPARAEAIRTALVAAGAPLVEAVPHPDDSLLAVHDAPLVDFLRGAHEAWGESAHTEHSGQTEVVGYIFPTPGFVGRVEPRMPASLAARTGAYCYDTLTVVTAGTWVAARGAVDAALTASDLVLEGAPTAYACCRPPGHHVTRSAFGGSCYLNNAAVAAQYLRDQGIRRVAIVDVDAHHGNGAQEVFWNREDVLTASAHVDPGAGWFPHFVGFADESGSTNLNVTLAPESGDESWLAAIDRLLEAAQAHASEAIVVALGVDAAVEDPNAPLRVTDEGFREAGRRLGMLGLPTVLVQEGGYVVETIGELVRTLLEGLEEEMA